MEPNDRDFTDMIKYAVVDLEGIKEYDADEWSQEFSTEDYSYQNDHKSKPFAYGKMLENVMEHLEKVGGVEFAVLKDPELGRWWSKKVRERERNRKIIEAKDKLLSTMSKEELKILGIRV